jgi:hypothetical protein
MEANDTTGLDTFTPCYMVLNHLGNLSNWPFGKWNCNLTIAIDASLKGY